MSSVEFVGAAPGTADSAMGRGHILVCPLVLQFQKLARHAVIQMIPGQQLFKGAPPLGIEVRVQPAFFKSLHPGVKEALPVKV